MGNVFKTEEQRQRWREYNREYNKKNYTAITIFLNKEKDKDLLDYLNSQGEGRSVVVKKLIRKQLEG